MKKNIELLILPRWLIPVEPAGQVFEDHAIAIDKGRIVAVLQQSAAIEQFLPATMCSLPEHVVVPGLVNLHTHAAMALLRGIADNLPLMDWLQDHIWPAEGRHLSPAFVADGTRLACAEMLRGGVTCFNDMYYYPKAAAEAALALGMRAAIGLVTLDFPTAYASDADDYLAKGMAARDEFRGEALLSFCLAPHAPYTVCDKSFGRVLTIAEQCELPIHLHLHETAQEIADSLKSHGLRPIERLRRLGLLGPLLTGAHGVHLDAGEIDLLAQHGASLAHCPSSNLKLASGLAPLPALIRGGINVGLGTDSAASNNRLDVFQEMRLAALLSQSSGDFTHAPDTHRILRMATLDGARALGLEKEIGSIEPGKAADLCALNFGDLGLVPCYDVASHIVYAAGREHVTDVWVCGQKRIADGQLVGNIEIELKKLGALWQNQICPRNA